MNSLKDTKLTLAMNCHRIVILYNEKMNNERTDTKIWQTGDFLLTKKLISNYVDSEKISHYSLFAIQDLY